MSASSEGCEVCETRPVCRVVDVGDRVLRICARCSEMFRREPEALLQVVRDAYAHPNERGDA
jgi:hypothetical protein